MEARFTQQATLMFQSNFLYFTIIQRILVELSMFRTTTTMKLKDAFSNKTMHSAQGLICIALTLYIP